MDIGLNVEDAVEVEVEVEMRLRYRSLLKTQLRLTWRLKLRLRLRLRFRSKLVEAEIIGCNFNRQVELRSKQIETGAEIEVEMGGGSSS